MSEKLAKIALALGLIISLLFAVKIIFGAKDEKGFEIAADVIILVGAMLASYRVELYINKSRAEKTAEGEKRKNFGKVGTLRELMKNLNSKTLKFKVKNVTLLSNSDYPSIAEIWLLKIVTYDGEESHLRLYPETSEDFRFVFIEPGSVSENIEAGSVYSTFDGGAYITPDSP